MGAILDLARGAQPAASFTRRESRIRTLLAESPERRMVILVDAKTAPDRVLVTIGYRDGTIQHLLIPAKRWSPATFLEAFERCATPAQRQHKPRPSPLAEEFA